MNTRLAVAGTLAAALAGGIVIVTWMERPEVSAGPSFDQVVQEEPGFRFEIVDTDAARAQGLSGRAEVPTDYGMLFVFDWADRYGFWMKDMRVPIDILWLADDGTVIGIEEAVQPETYPESFRPPEPVRLVLETRAGEARARGWGIGTRVPLPAEALR